MQAITITGELKTYEAWNGPWEEHFLIGDYVDTEMYDYVLGVLPPRYWKGDLLQMGEPYDHRGEEGRARFATFQKYKGQWVYTGHQVGGARVVLE